MASVTVPSGPEIDTGNSILQSVKTQSILLLQAPLEKYTLVNDYPIPSRRDASEILVQTEVIGLNPIDWKSPYVHSTQGRLLADKGSSRDFNFGIPHFPFVPGRELVGIVLQSHTASRFTRGDRVRTAGPFFYFSLLISHRSLLSLPTIEMRGKPRTRNLLSRQTTMW